jgi:thiol:disulfide interchange protein
MYYLDQALKISSKQKDNFHFSLAKDAKAALYLDNKNYSQALILSKEALKTNQLSQLQMAECQNYGTISTIYTELKTFDSALVYAKKGFKMAAGFEKASIVRECAKNLSTIYENKKNADSALKYFKIYFNITDSLKTESQLRGIAQKEFIFEKQNQEQLRAKEQLVAQTKLEKQKQINLIVIIASVLLSILLLISIINFYQKQKANALVLKQKKLLEEKNKEIIDSINYASRIQRSLMPTEKYITKHLNK